jgi:DNA polymerase I-like protein with 3'-5' exonuclease and polymerase domains
MIEDDDHDLDSFLTDAGTPVNKNPPETQPETVVEDELADEGALFEEADEPERSFGMLPDFEGDDPLDFIENSGFQRDRSVPDKAKPWMVHHRFEVATSVEQVNEIVDECIRAGKCSLDLETEGLDNRIEYRADGSPETVHKIVGYCISYDGLTGWYIPVRHKPQDGGPDLNVYPILEVEGAISRLCHAAIPEGTPEAKAADPLSYKCERRRLVIYFWNAQFDQEFLFPITGIDWWHPDAFEDGMLACFCIYAGDKRLSLKHKAKELLKDPDGNPYEMIELKELFFGRPKDIRFAILSPDEPGVKRYTGSDAICTFKLCELPEILPIVAKRHAYTYRMEKQVSQAIRVMERSRVRVNREHVQQLLQEMELQRDALLAEIKAFAAQHGCDLDPQSTKQLSEFLFGPRPRGLDITPKPEINEKSGQYKTDGDTLDALAKSPHAPRILKNIVSYRGLEKFIGTYLTGLAKNADENDEIRTSFKQTGAGSGRFSAPAGNPEHGYAGVPMHGIPGESELRRDFVARSGYTMIKADYAGEELRIATNVTREPVWIKEFLYGTGDLHSITARAFFNKQEVTKEERNAGKIANFVLLYGGGPKAVVAATHCSVAEGKKRKAAFDKAVPTFAAWCNGQHAKVKTHLGVWTPFNRWLAIPNANSDDPKQRSACERHSVNYVIQGAGADIMKICLIMLTKKFHQMGWLKNGGDDSVRMLLTVHDEVVFEVRHDRVAEAVPIIVEIMEYPGRMPQKPKWIIPLVVEPLLGFNWKSGYAAERATADRKVKEAEIDRVEQGIPLRKFEVLMNGFVYSTTREPKKHKETKEILESLDRQEVIEGKVFRVIDPPWLVGAALPPAPPKPEPTPEPSQPEPVKAERAPVEPAVEVALTPAAEPVSRPQPPEPGLFSLRLRFMDEQTAEQVAQIVREAVDDHGMYFRLLDTSSLAPVPVVDTVRDQIRVNRSRVIAMLRDKNLVTARDADEASQAT